MTGSVPLERLVPPGGMLRAWLERGAGAVPREGFLPPVPRCAEDLCAWAGTRPPEPAAASTVEAIVSSLEALGAPAVSRENAEALGCEGTLAVVTGQQPGLFGGPLYTVHKVATAVRLARAARSRCGPGRPGGSVSAGVCQ